MKNNSPTDIFKSDICQNLVAVITGGGSGIGYEIATQLGLHGAKLVLMGRREDVLIKACKELKTKGITAIYYAGDVRNEKNADEIMILAKDQFGGVDILVNAAAGNFLVVAEELSTKGFRTVIEIDTIGVFNMCRAAFPQLKLSKQASIVNISANLHMPATWYQSHASAAKAAIDSLTRSLALEWGSCGITVNGIAPGPILGTPGVTKLSPNVSENEIEKAISETIPAGRMGNKNEMAALALFLVSNAARYITGQTIVADGGEFLYRAPRMPREMVSQHSRNIESKSRKVGLPGSKL